MASSQQNSLDEARALEKRVLRHNDIDAMVDLGDLLLSDDSFVTQRARGVQMLERAIKQAQNPHAMRLLASYILDCGDANNHRRAVSLLERSLKLEENSSTINKLAGCYSRGTGVPKNHSMAAKLCERALRLDGDPVLMANLALNLLQIPNLRAQRKRAVALFEKAIHLTSNVQMMNLLGEYYHYGTANLSQCPRRARKWYKQAIITSKHVPSMCNLAVLLLANQPSSEDVQRAVRLLEAALEEQDSDVDVMLQVADAYSEYGIDYDRALELYETAAVRFDSDVARSRIIATWAADIDCFGVDHARTLNYCWDDFKKNKDFSSFLHLGVVKWTGAGPLEMNRKKAIGFLHHFARWNEHCMLSLMLRHDLNLYPSGEKNARRFMKRLDNNINRCSPGDPDAIILSESNCEDDVLLALESFRAQITRKRSSYSVVWLAPCIRRGRCALPFNGHLDSITNPTRRYALLKYVASLNLASLLLEREGKEQEAVAVLEDLMNTMLKLIAMMNLAYILMNNVKGVKQDRARGMQLLEDAVAETNDVSARAMLANALTERTECDSCDVERGWKLWESVQGEVEDEEELRKIGRLVSKSSKERWNIISRRRGDCMET